MERLTVNQQQPLATTDSMDPMTSHFDRVLVGRAKDAIEAISAARSSIQKCRQQRIEAYLCARTYTSAFAALEKK